MNARWPALPRARPLLLVSILLLVPTFDQPTEVALAATCRATTASTPDRPSPVLHIFPAQTTPGHEITLSGTVGSAISRPWEVQRLAHGSWRRVIVGVSNSRGEFAQVRLAPQRARVERYRVVARRHERGRRTWLRAVSCPVALTLGDGSTTPRVLPPAQLGTPYAVALGTPTDPPGTWTIANVDVPAGLHIEQNGLLTGTPAGEPNTHSFGATFTDRYGVSATSNLRLRVGRQAAVVPRDPGFSELLAYDDFQTKPNEPLVGTRADSGHRYDSYYGTYPPTIIDGAYRIDPAAALWNGWSFATLPEEQVPTSVGARFFFDKPRAYGGQEVVLALWRPNKSVGDSSVQFMATPGGWAMFKVVDGYRIYPEGGRGGYTTFPRQDGTVYEMSMHLDRSTNTVTVNLPDGTVKSWTDPDYSTFWGSTFAVQILRTTSSGDAGVTAIFSGK